MIRWEEGLTLNRLRILILTLALFLPALCTSLKPLLHPRALRHAARVKLQQLVHQVRSRHESPALVLLYHRVLPDAVDDGFRLVVTCEHFRAQLEWLREHADVVSLDQLDASRPRRSRSRRQVVITFDDGYRDNHRYASELLLEQSLPAIFYVCSGYIGTERRFWWDEVAARTLASANSTTAPGISLPTDQLLIQRTCSRLRPLPAPVRAQEIERLGTTPAPARPVDLPMAWSELRELHRMGFTIGAHSVNHPALSGLTELQAREEICRSRAMLEQALSRPVQHFCYPYDEAVRWGRQLPSGQARWVREAGFATGVTVVEGVVTRKTDPMAIPRLAVGDWTLAEFAHVLSPYIRPGHRTTIPSSAWVATSNRPADLGII